MARLFGAKNKDKHVVDIVYLENDSSWLKQMTYNGLSQILMALTTHGAVYAYAQVPPNVWKGLKNSISKGEFFHDNIKDKYSYCRLTA